jgi:hypothetical protein
MKWDWRQKLSNGKEVQEFYYDKIWSVVKHWADSKWYVAKGGLYVSPGHDTPMAAIEDAENRMKGKG